MSESDQDPEDVQKVSIRKEHEAGEVQREPRIVSQDAERSH